MRRTIQSKTSKFFPALLGIALLGIAMPNKVNAQAPNPYNHISGYVWQDDNVNGIKDPGERPLGGIVINLRYDMPGKLWTISATVTDTNGFFTIDNYNNDKTQSMRLEYFFPSAGFTVSPVLTSMNVASPKPGALNIAQSPKITMANNSDLTNRGMALVRIATTRSYWVVQTEKPTTWDLDAKFPKFVNGLPTDNGATLTGVAISMANFSFHERIGFENQGSGGDDISISAGGEVKLIVPDLPSIPGDSDVLVNTTQTITLTKHVGAFDGTVDYGGTSGYTWYNKAGATVGVKIGGSNIVSSAQYYNDPLDLAYFTGNTGDSVTLLAAGRGAFTATGGGNVIVQIDNVAGAGFYVTYMSEDPLPLVLTTFNVRNDKGTGLLTWKGTSDGTPGEYFVVEHSTDGRNFTSIGSVDAMWDKHGLQTYQFRHLRPSNGRNYYRIKMNETIGKPAFSNIQTLIFGAEAATQLTVYPVPAHTALNVEGAVSMDDVQLYSITGQQMTVNSNMNGDRVVLNTADLANGIYLLRVNLADGSTQTQRVVIQHK